MDKVVPSPADAVAGIASGASIAVGGFGLCGIPSVLIDALLERALRSENIRGRKSAKQS